jgi:hypothetical protein
MKMDPRTALDNLYIASRKADLIADDHDICRKSAQVLLDLIEKSEKKRRKAEVPKEAEIPAAGSKAS